MTDQMKTPPRYNQSGQQPTRQTYNQPTRSNNATPSQAPAPIQTQPPAEPQGRTNANDHIRPPAGTIGYSEFPLQVRPDFHIVMPDGTIHVSNDADHAVMISLLAKVIGNEDKK